MAREVWTLMLMLLFAGLGHAQSGGEEGEEGEGDKYDDIEEVPRSATLPLELGHFTSPQEIQMCFPMRT